MTTLIMHNIHSCFSQLTHFFWFYSLVVLVPRCISRYSKLSIIIKIFSVQDLNLEIINISCLEVFNLRPRVKTFFKSKGIKTDPIPAVGKVLCYHTEMNTGGRALQEIKSSREVNTETHISVSKCHFQLRGTQASLRKTKLQVFGRECRRQVTFLQHFCHRKQDPSPNVSHY